MESMWFLMNLPADGWCDKLDPGLIARINM